MAIEVERMIATLEANFSKYDRALNKALGNTNSTFSRIEKRGKALETRLAGIGSTFARSFAAGFAGAVSIRGAQQLIDAATRMENALKVAGLSGDELTRVYDRLFESATKNAAPIESLVTLYGRAALVQKELGVSTEELLGFTNNVALALRVAGSDAQSASGALLQLSQALGSGVVRADEFNSILEGAPTIAQAAAAGLEEAGGSVARLRQLVVDGAVSSEAFFRAFEAGAPILEQKVAGSVLTIDQRLVNLQNSLIDAAGRFNESTAAAETFGTAIDNTAAFVNSINFDSLIAQISAVIAQMGAGIDAANAFASAIGRITGLENIGAAITGGTGYKEFLGGALTVTSSKGIENRINDAFAGEIQKAGKLTEEAIRNSVLGEGGAATTNKTGRLPEAPYVTPVSLSDFAPPVAKGGGSGGGGGKSAAAAKRREEAAALREAAKAAKELERAEREAERAAQDMGSAIGDAVGGIISALSDGKLEAKELLGIVAQIATQLLSMNGGGGFAGGFLSSILGSVFHEGGVVGSGGSKRSVHPATFAGAPRYHSGGVAGLRPGEVPAILQRGEIVIPKGRAQAQSAGQSIMIHAPINAPGADAAALARVERSVKELGKNIPKMVDTRTDTRKIRKVRA
ncbi:tape measure protein [Mesorhizobium sp. WSM2239]|uniref:Tape measure protein n=2 Tax=unclassified Mesorhizobium TaxID=325217 RepID=A0AAU8D3Q0_9HYPH